MAAIAHTCHENIRKGGYRMLELLNFKPIGKAVLHRAIGLSENYTMDENIRLLTPAVPEQCIGCEQYKERCAYADFPQSAQYNDAVSACRKCQYGKTLEINTVIKPRLLEKEKKKRYVNEKNRYGYAKRLKLRSVLLFIAYHMIVSNSNGILRNVSISDLADLLKCSKRAIRYNNQILSEEGYIYISNGIDGEHINVCLPEYKSYFLPAQEGGRGFFTMSKELFTALCEIKQTTALRIVLKTLLSMETDVLSMNEPRLESYVQIRRYLPDYCKRNIVQAGDQLIPVFSKGNPEIPDAIYQEVKRKWEIEKAKSDNN